jgi:hypothetical protein
MRWGREIRVDGTPYTVIGVGEKQGKTMGQSQDNWVAVPITAFQKTLWHDQDHHHLCQGGRHRRYAHAGGR